MIAMPLQTAKGNIFIYIKYCNKIPKIAKVYLKNSVITKRKYAYSIKNEDILWLKKKEVMLRFIQ